MITVDEYLTSVYEPDCDFVDGKLLDRYLGEWDHSTAQFLVISDLIRVSEKLEFRVRPSLRMRINSSHYRVPDIIVLTKQYIYEPILTSPPFLCIEIVSPDDFGPEPLNRSTGILHENAP